jgi:hypothetical protein
LCTRALHSRTWTWLTPLCRWCDRSCDVYVCSLLCCSLGSASALVTCISVLCTLRTRISRITLQLHTLQPTSSPPNSRSQCNFTHHRYAEKSDVGLTHYEAAGECLHRGSWFFFVSLISKYCSSFPFQLHLLAFRTRSFPFQLHLLASRTRIHTHSHQRTPIHTHSLAFTPIHTNAQSAVSAYVAPFCPLYQSTQRGVCVRCFLTCFNTPSTYYIYVNQQLGVCVRC